MRTVTMTMNSAPSAELQGWFNSAELRAIADRLDIVADIPPIVETFTMNVAPTTFKLDS